jgi:hypothetical protein
MKTDTQLIEELGQATTGLLFMSEADYPFQTFIWKEKPDVTPEYLREQAGKPVDATLREVTVKDFFRAATSEAEWKNAEALALAKRYQALVKWLEENLSDLKVYRVGDIDIMVFILGRSAEGSLIGISTRVIET